MGYILHENATVLCLHAGQATPMVTDQHVKVNGQKILTQSSTYTISGCTFPPPPNGNGPCVTATWLSAATRVKASGLPVLLRDSQATCTPTGTGLNILVTQVRVKAI
jgi:hypothetical protein